jgi:hypothetical protein
MKRRTSRTLRDRFVAAAREPLVHFLMLGALIYGVASVAAPGTDEPPEDRITVTAGEIDWITSSWEKRWSRPPTPQERQGLIDEFVRETIYYRAALAMGLDRDDTIIRRRLAQKLEFLTQDLATAAPPTEEEIQAFLAENADRYAQPALVTFTQVFVDPDARGEHTLEDAERIVAELRAQGPPSERSAELGDRFMLQAYYPERTEQEIAKLFGSEFAQEVAGLEPGRWQAPVLSGYGVHLVYLSERSDPVPAQLADVREDVLRDLEQERRSAFDAEYYAALRERYEVVIEDGPGEDYAAAEVASW